METAGLRRKRRCDDAAEREREAGPGGCLPDELPAKLSSDAAG